MARQVNGKGFIFLTHTQNNKKDPLSFQEKQAYITSQINDPNLQIGSTDVKIFTDSSATTADAGVATLTVTYIQNNNLA